MTSIQPKPLLLIVTLLLCFNVFAKTWYVKQNNTGTIFNGYSWFTATKNLTSAIDSSRAGDTIKVAEGLYFPGLSRSSYFLMKNQVVLLGGYSSADSTLPRNFSSYKTILSGRYSSNEKAEHVILASGCNEFTLLDGFIIEEGRADGSGFPENNHWGAGILVSHASKLKIQNCIFRNHFATNGSAMAIIGNSNPTIQNCFFINNATFRVGTIFIESSSNTRMINCVFADNNARESGAVFYSSRSTVSLINCTFFRNIVEEGGNLAPGVISSENNCVLNISNSVFFANSTNYYSAFWGADRANYEGPEITAPGCTLNISNSLTQNITTGSNIKVSENPRFKDTSNIAGPDRLFFTEDDGLQLLLPCSPALNTAENSYLSGIAIDIAGRPRVFNIQADMGAYEAQAIPGVPLKIAYVNANATGSNDGSSWANAFTSLQQALLPEFITCS